MNETSTQTHWYQSPIGWLIFAVILATLTSGVLMITISSSDPDDIVVDDYYKRGLAINESKKRNTRARRLGIHAGFRHAGQRIEIQVTGLPVKHNHTIRLHLQHPTRSRFDRLISLPCSRGVCRAAIPLPNKARYYYIIEPQDRNWRLSGRLHIDGNGLQVSRD